MTEITDFVALAFDLIDGGLVAGEAVDCANPAVAIQTAQGQWKILGHAGAVAFSRTSDFEKGKFNHRHVLRRLGRCRTSTDEKMMTNEFRIVAMIFGLSISAASAQDIAAGETSYRRCLTCHSIGAGARNKSGPLLNGIDGRKCGSVDGYSYSKANRNCAFTWNEATFVEYVRDPKAKIQGTKKSSSGIKDATEARNLWAYLRQFGADGQPK